MPRLRRTAFNNMPDELKTANAVFGNFTSRLDIVIELLLVCLLAFMPLAFGVVHAWSEQIVIFISGTIVLCFLLKFRFHNEQNMIWTWAYVPLLAFLLLAVFQLVPLPSRLISTISPNTAVLRTELLGDLHNADEVLQSATLSLYPHATKHDLRMILAVAGVFVVVLNVFRRPEQIKRLLTAIAVIGGIVAIITLAQNLLGNGKIYWFISSRHSSGYSGPFVNHSNYGQFMNLSIGAALTLLMVKLHDIFGSRKITLPAVFDYFSSCHAIPLWLIIAVIVTGITTIFTSLTRGGMVSMLIAMGLTTLLVTSKQHLRSHGWAMVVIALVAFICVLYIGFDSVYDRLSTLRDFKEANAYRLQILRDITVVWNRFPVLGTGLGTHSIVYPMFDRSNTTLLAAYAENEYAQTLEETGLVGLCLLVAFGIVICSNCVKSIRDTELPIRSAVFGLSFGILAILIQSFNDFGQHLPANAFLSAIFCALMIALVRQGPTVDNSKRKNLIHANKTIQLMVFCSICAILVWAFAGANKSRLAEANWNKVRPIEKILARTNWQGTRHLYSDLLSNSSAALACEPENVKYLYWYNVYRWRSINQTANPNIAEPPALNDSMPEVRDIVEQLHKARAICPTYGPTYTLVGQIEKFILNDESGAERIRKGYLLAPGDPISCFIAGYLDIVEGKYEDCPAKFEKAVQLDGDLFKDVAKIYVDYLSRPHLAMSLAWDDIGRLEYLAGILAEAQYEDLAHQSQMRILSMLEEQCASADAPASALAHLADIRREQQEIDEAIECYQRALALNYSQVGWRIKLAKLLAETNRIQQAIHEAKICLRLRPNLEEAQNLVADLSVQPAGWGKEVRSQ